MAWNISRYLDFDLAFKSERDQNSKDDGIVACFQQQYIDLGGPSVPGRVGAPKPLVKDGLFGPQTANAVKVFQKSCGIPVTGKLDHMTYFHADWRTYGYGPNAAVWKPTSPTHTSTGEGGPAIRAGHNMYMTNPKIRVSSNGMSREAQRLSDVKEARYRRSLGYEGAVNRNAVGTSSLSRHALSLAGDDMADQDKDRIIDPEEIIMMQGHRIYMFQRAQVGPEFKAQTYVYTEDGATHRIDAGCRGLDLLVTMVVGNLMLPDGTWMFPDLPKRYDASWRASRNTWIGSSKKIHVAPFHFHDDCAVGAPFGPPTWLPLAA